MINNKRKIHIRRCHICSTVNEQASRPVVKCTGCGKSLAPFMFFDERHDADPDTKATMELINIDEVGLKSGSLYEHMKTQYPPLRGITVYW